MSNQFVIRFEDARYIGGFKDLDFPTEKDARDGWENMLRKRSRTDAILRISGCVIQCYWGKSCPNDPIQ